MAVASTNIINAIMMFIRPDIQGGKMPILKARHFFDYEGQTEIIDGLTKTIDFYKRNEKNRHCARLGVLVLGWRTVFFCEHRVSPADGRFRSRQKERDVRCISDRVGHRNLAKLTRSSLE